MNRIEKLQALRDWFASVPEEKINMTTWAEDYDPQGSNEQHSCLTAGCLFGWAAVYKPFVDLGLSIHRKATGVYRINYKDPATKLDYSGEMAFAKFFETDWDDSLDLILPMRYDRGTSALPVPKSQVLERLDYMIQKYTKLEKSECQTE